MALASRKAVAEAARSSRAHPATTIVLVLVALATTIATFLTAGRAAATEAEILASVEAAGARLIAVTVTEPHPGLSSTAVERLASVGDVDWVLALGPARDVTSTSTGVRANIAARTVLTPLPDLVEIDPGRIPRPGEAVVSEDGVRRLQLEAASGSLTDDGVPRSIVGEFSAGGAVENLERLALVYPDAESSELATLVYVLADDATHVNAIVEAVRAVAGVPIDNLAIETSEQIIELGNAASGSIGSLGRQLSAGAIAAGAILSALTVTLALLSRRRDIGRRRALGASRSAIVALALLETSMPIIVGAAGGTLVGGLAVVALSGSPPPLAFAAAAPALIAIISIASSVPPALRAAWQDPLRILRVP